MRSLTIKINLDNAAFQDGNETEEIKRILDKIKGKLGITNDSWLLDINGNKCGFFKIEEGEGETT